MARKGGYFRKGMSRELKPGELSEEGIRLNGKVIEYGFAGLLMSPVKKRFQAIADLMVTWERTWEAIDSGLMLWPVKRPPDNRKQGEGYKLDIEPGTILMPPIHQLRDWYREVVEGTAVIDQKVREDTEKRYYANLKREREEVIRGAQKAARHMQQKILGDTITGREVVAYKYTHDGAGFLYNSLKEEQRPTTNIQIGRLRIDAGAPPKKITVEKPKKQVGKEPVAALPAEFRVLPEAAESSPS